ncbi:MAG: hypothetical protein AAF557_24635 [Pseudomonadota bacterium]
MFRTFMFAVLLAGTATVPALAEPPADENPSDGKGLSGLLEKFGPQIEELTREMQEDGLRDLWEQLEPQLEDLQREMEPAWQETLKLMDRFRAMDNPRNYQLPEVLPNGDIIIRRREDAPPYEAPENPETGPQPDGTVKT